MGMMNGGMSLGDGTLRPQGGKGQQHPIKPGDWHCPSCNDLQFAKNDVCRKCGTPNPDPAGSLAAREQGIASGGAPENLKPGDWYCPSCGDLQFARNAVCRKCATPNPDPEGSMEAASASGNFKPQGLGGKGGGNFGKANDTQKKPGDWHCSSCGDLQFARNMECRKCGTPNLGAMLGQMGMMGGCGMMGGGGGGYNPMMQMQQMQQWGGGNYSEWGGKGGGGGGGGGKGMMPGDWACPACGDHQFARNAECRKCGAPNPAGSGAGAKGGGKGINNNCSFCAQGSCWTHGTKGGHGAGPY